MASKIEYIIQNIYNRKLAFLNLQFCVSFPIFMFSKYIITYIPSPSVPRSEAVVIFSSSLFIVSQLPFAFYLSTIPTHQPTQPLPLLHLVLSLRSPWSSDRRALLSLNLVRFVAAAALSGFLAAVSFCWLTELYVEMIWGVGFEGLVCGLLYAGFYLYKQRWVYEFPVVQQDLIARFKMGIPSVIAKSFMLSSAAALLVVFVAEKYVTIGLRTAEQRMSYIGIFVVFLCWELDLHLLELLHTERFIFAPPKGSAAAKRNPSKPLLAALNGSIPNSLLQYRAYFDLCMVCETNGDTWRRAAFFESGETYRSVIAACLRPLEELATKLGEGMKPASVDKASDPSKQLQLPTDVEAYSNPLELLNKFQLYVLCARSIASLTAHSRREDWFRLAQRSGSNAVVVSTLLSCLLAVEDSMEKKMNFQSPHRLKGPANVKGVALKTGEIDVRMLKKSGELHARSHALADVLRASIHSIVTAFHDEMIISAKARPFGKDWLASGRPLFGRRKLHAQKLRNFLKFQSS